METFRKYIFALFAGLIISLHTHANAQINSFTTVEVNDGISQLQVSQMLDFFLDTTSQYSIKDISSPEFQHKFQKVTDDHVIYDYLDSDLWMRLTVSNKQREHNQSWYFESWGFDIKKFTFYFPNPDGTYHENTSGFSLPFFDRNIHHKNFNQFLDLRPGETKTYYLKVQRNYNQQFSFYVRSNERFLAHSLNEYFLLGTYYGVLILILIFNLYLFIKLKDLLYLYFPCLILACIWFSLGRDGLGFQYLWPNSPWINKLNNEKIIELFIILATLLFSNRYIQKYTKSDKVFKATIWAAFAKLLLFLSQIYVYELYYINYLIITFLILIIPFSMGLYTLAKEKIYSWSYIFAFACLFLVIVYSYSKSIQLFDNPVINWYFVYPVIFIEMILFSFSIFKQIKFLQDEYVNANKERTLVLEKNNQLTLQLNSKLKEKVKARTEKIEKMASDLAKKNVELQTTNLRLEELNAQVTQMNKFLEENNKELKMSVQVTTKDLALMKGLDFEDFKKVFPNKEACFQFLSELKWKDNFHCKKCGYNKYNEGANFGRRCRNCNYYESPTVDTLFHKLKFPIEKAFYILYLTNRKDVNLSLNEISEILELRRETCWAFKNKINLAMEKVNHNKDLSGWETLALVHLD
ncbi:7TM diverse intracellular signaling domain-containing protein [Belliella kenyensis]|uniref:7TM diverse intracellular signaling domain-containing protein n=1 Tax=Belliella kenyensis TaxID=1472724 RepID=A0ABV8ER57_9BACT|nr:7TM diverse intracellular signaling domain-containing protein [Belliella kenyensis]MCH7402022.1 signal transduction protein [Belliella kenyensis]MDN3605186.1 7TM diverse intracellular signaling domain-containing protein [Belliella kenyensis]